MRSHLSQRFAGTIALVIALSGCDRQVTQPDHDAFDTEPSASMGAADVGTMTYLIGRSLDFDVYVGRADGTGLVDLSMNDEFDSGPVLSPDGMKVAFFRTVDVFGTGDSDIYVIDVDGSDERRLTSDGTAENPHWSPSGRQIAFGSGQNLPGFDIWVMNADGTGAVDITNSDSHDGKPVWSPNGRRIAFTSDRDPTNDENDIYVMDADGSNVRRLTTTGGLPVPWSWSPDGTRIAFFRDGNIMTVNADGSGETILTNDPAVSDGLPSFSPNGRFIAFSRDPVGPGDARPFVMNADGSNIRPIPIPASVVAGGRIAHPWDWSHR